MIHFHCSCSLIKVIHFRQGASERACYSAGAEMKLTFFFFFWRTDELNNLHKPSCCCYRNTSGYSVSVLSRYFSILVMQSRGCSFLFPGFFMETGRGGLSIGVTEWSLCPGQRVQWLHPVFSIPSTPPLPPATLTLGFSTILFSPHSGISSFCTWPALKRALRVCVCVWMWAIGNITEWRKGNMKHVFVHACI